MGKKYGLPEHQFPTMVIGSLPRPQWVRDVISERALGQISETEADRLLAPAVLFAIRMQEKAGLDYVSDGEWRRENYVSVFADRANGFTRSNSPGLHSTHVTSRVSTRRPIACEDAAFLRENTKGRILVPLPSPFTVGRHLWHPELSRSAYPDRDSFVMDCADILREEVLSLARLGVDAIQIDEPWQAWLSNPELYHLNTPAEIEAGVELAIRTVNQVIDGLDEVFISVHLCHSHGVAADRSPDESVLMEAVHRIHAHRFAMEFNSPASGGFDKLAQYPADKILGVGVIDPTSPEAEGVETVLERAQQAMQFVAPERIVLNPDCGFATSAHSPRNLDTAYKKLKVMCEAAEELRHRS